QIPSYGSGASQFGELIKNESDWSLHLLIRIENDCAVRLMGQTSRQECPQLSALGLMPSARVQTSSDLMEFCFAHHSRQTENQAIVIKTRIIEPLAIS